MELHCATKIYPWGKVGKSSIVAQLSLANSSTSIDEQEPYAELWMGTHPSGPSLLPGSGETLLSYLTKNEGALSEAEKEMFGTDLPFLFKVLSVAQALSLQAHPDKQRAKELFATRPDLYKDPNHKPEMVTAWMGPFQAMCGFRPAADIRLFLREIDELAALVGKEACEELNAAASDDQERQAVGRCFTALMNCNPESIAEALKEFELRLASLSDEKKDLLSAELFRRIAADFPGDVGCWSVYFLNFVVLQEGESLFLGPNVPHAYVYGECVECMACSDNVVRAGLTPKFKDIDTLCSMLDFSPGPIDRFRVHWVDVDAFCQVCTPPVPDFALARLRLPAGSTHQQPYCLPARPNASILLVLQGRAECCNSSDGSSPSLEFGRVLFLKAGQALNPISRVLSQEDLVVYQAFSNV